VHGGGSGIEQRDQKLKMYRESFLVPAPLKDVLIVNGQV
jgi:hypothetical protein